MTKTKNSISTSSNLPGEETRLHILLADDDIDDCLFFKEALEELSLHTRLTTVEDGEELMQTLEDMEIPPGIIFLDLNMPRKNGFDCLAEIKQQERLKEIPVICISTSFDKETVNRLYKTGALHYIQKPNEFSQLTKLIHRAITLAAHTSQVKGLTGGDIGEVKLSSLQDFVIVQAPS